MDDPFSAVKWRFALVYLDSMVSSSCSAAEHADQFNNVLELLRDRATLKPEKYNSYTIPTRE